MGLFFSSYQCVNDTEQCTYKGPYHLIPPGGGGGLNIGQPQDENLPQEIKTLLEGKSNEELATLYAFDGNIDNMTEEQKKQGLCNALGGGHIVSAAINRELQSSITRQNLKHRIYTSSLAIVTIVSSRLIYVLAKQSPMNKKDWHVFKKNVRLPEDGN